MISFSVVFSNNSNLISEIKMAIKSDVLRQLDKKENQQLRKERERELVGLIPRTCVEKSKAFLRFNTAKAMKDRLDSFAKDRSDVFSQSEHLLWTQSLGQKQDIGRRRRKSSYKQHREGKACCRPHKSWIFADNNYSRKPEERSVVRNIWE